MTAVAVDSLFRSVNPADGTTIRTFQAMDWHEVDAVLDRAQTAFERWSAMPVQERAHAVGRVADALRARRPALSRLLTQEMGKPIAESQAEVDKCADAAEWLAEHGPSLLEPLAVPTRAEMSEVRFAPLGVVLAIMPWNYPLWQVLRAALPALLAGNAVVLKHAPNVSGSAYEAQRLFDDPALPDDLLSVILADEEITAQVIADRRVVGVTLTGSVRAGEAIGAQAGRHLKKVVLELGGSDPFVVLSDADVQKAAAAACRGRMQNNGQSCIAAKRFIVVRDVSEEFIASFTSTVAGLRVGDPMDPRTDIGPLAREDIRDELQRQLDESVSAGARIAVGGELIDQPGWWFTPTVLVDVEPDMPVWREETFGPLTGVLVVENDEEALAAAEHPDYGLGASLWTRDWQRGRMLADLLDTGMVFINSIVASNVQLPFGGVRRSGVGRELGSFGLREFVNVKTVCVGSPTGAG